MKIFRLLNHVARENTYLLVNDQAIIIVDPGSDTDKIKEKIQSLDKPVAAILLTHAHYDHIMAVNEIKEAYPSCRVMIAEAERPMVENSELNCNFFPGEYRIEPDRYLKDGDEIEAFGRSFRVIASPGHTAGSVCYYSEEDGVLFSGDTLFQGSCGRTDFPGGSWTEMEQSLKRLYELPGDYLVLSGHTGSTSLDRERKTNMFMRSAIS